MKNRYTVNVCICILLSLLTAGLAHGQNTIAVSGAGIAAVNGTYTYAGISNSRPYYTKGSYRIEYRNDWWNMSMDIWMIWNTSDIDWAYYGNTSASATPAISGWYTDMGSGAAPTVTNQVAFSNGSGYNAPAPVPGTNNNAIGRFLLDPGAESAITAATVQLGGTPSGITAVKLWRSADATFSSAVDVQLSSKPFASSVTFNGFSSNIDINGTYYFITADVSAGATGSVAASIANAAAFTLSSGSSISTAISNAGLSAASVPLPVHLLSFTARSNANGVMLQWATTGEESFAGFEPERSADGSNWNKMAFIAGKSNNISAATQYNYTDNTPLTGYMYYRLKMIDADGGFIYSKQLTVINNRGSNAALQNYPNPFSGHTSIAFRLPVGSMAVLKVFNNMGAEVSTLVNKQLEAGNYTVSFDGASLPAGVYHYTLRYGKEKLSGTMLLKP